MLAEHVDHVVGIDPDHDRITAAVVAADSGGVIVTAEFTTTAAGYAAVVDWADTHTDPGSRAWSIEGAGSFGAGATEHLSRLGEWVIEFDRPTVSTRKDRAKTDTLDAVRAAPGSSRPHPTGSTPYRPRQPGPAGAHGCSRRAPSEPVSPRSTSCGSSW